MKNILIIDDSEVVRKGIENLLNPLGIQCFHAVNGIDGIRKALRYHPDVITMDLEMPLLNGILTTRILSMLDLKIPTVFITSRGDVQEQVKKYSMVVGFCLKADLKTGLFDLIEQALNQGQKEFADLTYTLRQREVLDLFSLSQRKKLLILEDSQMMMSVILKHLDRTNLFELYHASNGKEGLFKATMIEPDLILSDIEMPVMDGITMAQTLYILGRAFPIAFVSGKNDEETVKKVMKLEGVRGYLIKHDVLKDGRLFQQRVEELMKISDEEKLMLQQNYQSINMSKLKESGEKMGVFRG